MSKGTFKTSKVGDDDILLPEFSKTKMAHIKPETIMLPAQLGLSVYDLIIGFASMSYFGINLDLTHNSISWDHVKLSMLP